MKNLLPRVALATLLSPVAAFAADPAAAPRWFFASPISGLVLMILFSLAGTALAIVGYRLFDKFTPGDLHREIVEQKNVAAAIIGGAVILGVCIIVAAAMVG
jgi:hypothetical protein